MKQCILFNASLYGGYSVATYLRIRKMIADDGRQVAEPQTEISMLAYPCKKIALRPG